MRLGVAQTPLTQNRLAKSEFGGGRAGVYRQRRRKSVFRFGEVLIVEMRLRVVKCWPEFHGLLLTGGFQIRERLWRILDSKQADPHIQLRFIKPRLQIEHGLVFRNRLRVFSQQTVGQRKVKVRAVVLGILGDGFGEKSNRFVIALPVKRLNPLRLIVDVLCQKGGQNQPHGNFILPV